jgi:hypothetical protein
MAIKAKNILVGGQKPPIKTETKNSFAELLKKQNQQKIEVKPVVKQQPIIESETQEEPSRYLEKIDGDLVRHINKKSSYLTDMLEIES